MERKLKEAILSPSASSAPSPTDPRLLNEIYLGGGAYGVAAAAETYWNKSLNELSIADCAISPRFPGAEQLQPVPLHETAIERRNWVIDRMVENGFVARGRRKDQQPLGVQVRRTGASFAIRIPPRKCATSSISSVKTSSMAVAPSDHTTLEPDTEDARKPSSTVLSPTITGMARGA